MRGSTLQMLKIHSICWQLIFRKLGKEKKAPWDSGVKGMVVVKVNLLSHMERQLIIMGGLLTGRPETFFTMEGMCNLWG